MRTKICGITNLEDALHACKHGADALGFVFYEKSPRYVTKEIAKQIIDDLPPFVERVGLFVNHSSAEVNEIAAYCNLSTLQIHFEADDSFYEALEYPYIKVVRAKSKDDLLKYNDEYRFVDAFVEEYGGAGKRVNIDWFDDIDKSKIILAGGLNSENLDEIIDLGFYGVDVSSGVEAHKGKKDALKVERFLKKAKNGTCKTNK
jgi:phosphoribosylanthranilate isomerase